MLGKDLHSYVNLEVSIHELLLLTLPLRRMFGRRNYKPLSFSMSDWNFDLMSTTWVVTIVENEKMIEYVDLLYKLLFDSFWCCDKLQLLQWLKAIGCWFSVRFLIHALLCEGIITSAWEIICWYCCSDHDHDACMFASCFVDTSLPKHVVMFTELGFRLRTSEV